MKILKRIISGPSQLQWAILLVGVAVVLPSVCLIWFMVGTVRNERLAVRQKLVDFYEPKLAEMADAVVEKWVQRAESAQRNANNDPWRHFDMFIEGNLGVDGELIYDGSGELVYPVPADSSEPPELGERFEQGWEYEFVDGDFAKAEEVYTEIAGSDPCDYVWRKAMLGRVRCQKALGDILAAWELCGDIEKRAIPSGPGQRHSISLTQRVWMERNDMVGLLEEGAPTQAARNMAAARMKSGRVLLDSQWRGKMDSATWSFALSNGIRRMKEVDGMYRRLAGQLAAEQFSVKLARRYGVGDDFGDWASGSVRKLDVDEDVYGLYVRAGDVRFLMLRRGEGVRGEAEGAIKRLMDEDVRLRIVDDRGNEIVGDAEIEGKALAVVSMAGPLAGWRAELYLRSGHVLEAAAQRRISVYVWVGVLVIVSIGAAGAVAGGVVGRQIKLNRLKNDFIATVSHELRTPLASTRIMIDTLLEGNYRDEAQAREYLELASKENERLSGLIENFLGFSRMERNKRVFDTAAVSAEVIARDAGAAVGPRFAEGKCKFEVKVAEGLAAVSGDHDAMVTVLVNLLDNAYKYSYEDKEITLGVYSQGDWICFSVSDNGLGMSRRYVKKIFGRFYQIDRSLSRSTEGCGLGLSIVKFIVDAHGGVVEVESRPGKGSTFTVKLRVAE